LIELKINPSNFDNNEYNLVDKVSNTMDSVQVNPNDFDAWKQSKEVFRWFDDRVSIECRSVFELVVAAVSIYSNRMSHDVRRLFHKTYVYKLDKLKL